MKTLKLIMFVLFAASTGFAQETRNSGNSETCYDRIIRTKEDAAAAKIISVQLYDIVESRAYFKENMTYFPFYDNAGNVLQADLSEPGDQDDSVETKVNNFIKRVEKQDPRRGKRYREYQSIIMASSTEFVIPNLELVANDGDHPRLELQPPCYREQFAVQYKHPAQGQRRFEISGRLYDSPVTTNDTRAEIRIHEMVLRDAILNDGVINSDSIRPLVYFYSTKASKKMDGFQVSEFYQRIGLKPPADIIEFEDTTLGRVLVYPEDVYQNGRKLFGKGRLKGKGFDIQYDNTRLPEDPFSRPGNPYYYSGTRISITKVGERYRLNSIESGTCQVKTPCVISIQGKKASVSLNLSVLFMHFYPSGQIEKISFNDSWASEDASTGWMDFVSVPQFAVRGTPCIGSATHGARFEQLALDRNGKISGCDIGKRNPLIYTLPSGIRLPLVGFVRYYDSGKLMQAVLNEPTKINVYKSSIPQLVLPKITRYYSEGATSVLYNVPFELSEEGVLTRGTVQIADTSDSLFKITRTFETVLWTESRREYQLPGGHDNEMVKVSGIRFKLGREMNNNYTIALSKFCGSKYLTPIHTEYGNNPGVFINERESTVIGQEKVYNILTGKTETLTDERALLADGVFCWKGTAMGEFEFP